ncbi:ATP-binding cassette domain-containing protein [Candidatus Sumerlaeota bacterium]|nr:ATP-binding cassette domain-containing protein [Candidatus Sumerlaeota bacterium]
MSEKTVAVVGHTGAGKSTLINLLTRFYDPAEGSIQLDGVDLRRFDPHKLRRMFAVVLQEVFLFSGTIASNIRLANPELTDEQIWDLLCQVRADDFVRALPGGINARVHERGGTFSTGQKQLLAFARALASDPQVLILDEATANVDTETERRIQDAIARLLQGRTALVIAHRISTIQKADLILVMHKGKLHESGTHDELIERDGLYRRLYELQYRPETVVAAG